MSALTLPPSEPLGLPLQDWPAADRAAWRAVAGPTDDLLADTSRVADWAASTRHRARWSVGRFMAWLAAQGLGVGSTTIAAVVTPQVLAAFVREEQQRKRLNTIATQVCHIAGALELFAPDQDWRWAWDLHWRVVRHARQVPPLPRPLAHSRGLMTAGVAAMRAAGSLHPVDLSGFRGGICVALLAAAPMRIGNFAALRIGPQLIQQGAGWRISLSAAETKTRRPDTWPVPEALNGFLQRYLAEIRPALLARRRTASDTDRLWIGNGGGPVEQQTVRTWIAAVTAPALGVAITPHRFRHAAATTYTLERPSNVVDAAALLGHASAATTERHYIAQQRLVVQQDYLKILRVRQSGTAATIPNPTIKLPNNPDDEHMCN